LNLTQVNATDDIRAFIEDEFSRLYTSKRCLRDEPRPSKPDVDALVHLSSGSYIYASTVVKFVCDGNGLPRHKLRAVLSAPPGLDALYQQVFNAAPERPYVQRVIGTIALVHDPLSAHNLGLILQLSKAEIWMSLEGFFSILLIPEAEGGLIQLLHASMLDFLKRRDTAGEFFVDFAERHADIVMSCLEIMMKDRKNDKGASEASIYAFRNWCYHLHHVLLDGDGRAVDLISHDPWAKFVNALEDPNSKLFHLWTEALDGRRYMLETQKYLSDTLKVCRFRIFWSTSAPMLFSFS
jgi:hypothetical protein